MSDSDRRTGPNRPGRRGPRIPPIDEDKFREELLAKMLAKNSAAVNEANAESPAAGVEEPAPDAHEAHDGNDDDDEPDEEITEAKPDRESTARPFIKITPAREQVTPGHVVKALYGLYRTGNGRQLPFDLEQRLSFLSTHLTFEFLVHKPRGTQRFDFYLGVRPYEREAFETLAANVRAMYPSSFHFEIVPFSTGDVFEPSDSARTAHLAPFEGINELGRLEGFAPVDVDATYSLVPDTEADPDDYGPPELVRWNGVETKNNDWMTLLSRFSELALDDDDGYRSPLSVLLEQALATDEPFIYQVVFTPRYDWTRDAETHKRNLKMGTTSMWSAFKQEAAATLLGTSEEERRQRHRPDTPEQIGGSISGSDATGQSTQHGRMQQIDLKQPAVTFEVSLRAAGDMAVISGIAGAFTSLSGPYYGIEGEILGENDGGYRRLTDATLSHVGFTDTFSDTTPVIVASPDELANFVTVPNTGSLPKPSRGASGGTPDARSPLTATNEEQLRNFDTGMCLGAAETASHSRPNIPIRCSAEQLTHHILRASTTGGGKTTAMINDALTAHEELDGPIFIFDKKGGSMCDEYKRAHFKRFGNLKEVIHLPVPGPNGELPAFAFFDIRPQLAAGVPREAAVQEKVDRYNELLTYVLGEEQHNQAFVAQEILSNLIVALFDPVYGDDAYAISDLLTAAREMQTERVIPKVCNPEFEESLARHFSAEDRRFATSIDAVLNRITKLRERDFIWRMLNFVPEWDDEREEYTSNQMLFDLDEILDSKNVVLIDTGEFRPASSNLFTVLVLDYLWSWVRLRKRWDETLPTPEDGYCINLIIDEAAPILQASLLREEMIPDAREFALAFEVIVHFPEQVKRDAMDTRGYKEILRNINTKLIGKLAADDELATTLFHEELDAEALADRIASLPRGEWLAQLPDTGFMTDTPELVTLKPLPLPPGHSDSDEPVNLGTHDPETGQTYQEANHEQWTRTRSNYCLIPGVNCPLPTSQREGWWGADPMKSSVVEAEMAEANDESDSAASDDDAEAAGDDDEDEDPVGWADNTPTRGDSSDSSDNSSDPASGGAWNKYGTVIGTGITPEEARRMGAEAGDSIGSQTTSPPADGGDPVGNTTGDDDDEDDLTDDEREFLRTVVKALNGELEGYDFTQSMTTIRNTSGSQIDISKLEKNGYLEVTRVRGKKYYYVTPDGQTVIDRTLYHGRNVGDPHEKPRHKVYIEYLKRYIERNGFIVETYFEPMGGGVIYDVAAFSERSDGTRKLQAVGEVIGNSRPDWIVKHYDDMVQHDNVLKLWVVQSSDVAHELVRVLRDADRIENVPYKSVKNYDKITDEAFGEESRWRIIGATNLIDTVKKFSAEDDQ